MELKLKGKKLFRKDGELYAEIDGYNPSCFVKYRNGERAGPYVYFTDAVKAARGKARKDGAIFATLVDFYAAATEWVALSEFDPAHKEHELMAAVFPGFLELDGLKGRITANGRKFMGSCGIRL